MCPRTSFQALLICASAFTLAPAPAPEALSTVAGRVARNLVAADWSAFRKDAAPEIFIEEHWTAYDDYFVKDHQGDSGMLGKAEFKYVGYVTIVKNTPQLPKAKAALFRAFCKQVKDSRYRLGPHPQEWLYVFDRVHSRKLDHGYTAAPCAAGTILSNVDWSVEFALSEGKWKARRLLLGGH